MAKRKEPKSIIKATLHEWDYKTGDVLKKTSLQCWSGHLDPEVSGVVLAVTGPDDRGRCKDIIIDMKSLIKELEKHKLVNA